MKNALFPIFCLSAATALVCSAENYSFDHGPYLQELTDDGVTIVFTTSGKGYSWVEIREKSAGEQAPGESYWTSKDGLKEADNTLHAIRIPDLKPNTAYQYKLHSKEITKFAPYRVTFGEEIASPWYDFKTFDPQATTCSVIAMSDVHDHTDQLKDLLKFGNYNTCDAIFYVGDMLSNSFEKNWAFKSYIDASTEMFAKNKPFIFVRGNHETRGPVARMIPAYTPRTNGEIYGTQRIGNTFFVFLDTGEDKPNDHREYFGLVDFDAYRTRQAKWLSKVVETPEYKQAACRIVFSHFPISEIEQYNSKLPDGQSHGMKDASDKMLKILNNANVDLMVAGHTHRFAYHESVPGKRNFPILVGSNKSAVRLDIENGTIKAQAYDIENKPLLETTLGRREGSK